MCVPHPHRRIYSSGCLATQQLQPPGGSHMLTNVYVDGMNLFYGCLKRTPYKWLDLHDRGHQDRGERIGRQPGHLSASGRAHREPTASGAQGHRRNHQKAFELVKDSWLASMRRAMTQRSKSLGVTTSSYVHSVTELFVDSQASFEGVQLGPQHARQTVTELAKPLGDLRQLLAPLGLFDRQSRLDVGLRNVQSRQI